MEALARLGTIEVKETRRGRLIVALDLTGSREHSLKQARIATTAMFDTIKALGAVAVKMAYFRGSDECRATQWHSNPDILSQSMQRLSCETGETQIARVLRLALAEKEAVGGLVYVGDHCEDDPGELRELSALLGQRSCRLFMFHECADHDERSLKAKPVFKRMAEPAAASMSSSSPIAAWCCGKCRQCRGARGGGSRGGRQVALPKTPEARELQGRCDCCSVPRGRRSEERKL